MMRVLKKMVLHDCVNIISASQGTEGEKLITALVFSLTKHFYLKNSISALLRIRSFILHDAPERQWKGY